MMHFIPSGGQQSQMPSDMPVIVRPPNDGAAAPHGAPPSTPSYGGSAHPRRLPFHFYVSIVLIDFVAPAGYPPPGFAMAKQFLRDLLETLCEFHHLQFLRLFETYCAVQRLLLQ